MDRIGAYGKGADTPGETINLKAYCKLIKRVALCIIAWHDDPLSIKPIKSRQNEKAFLYKHYFLFYPSCWMRAAK